MTRPEGTLTAWTVLAMTGTAQAFNGLGANVPQIRAEATDHETAERLRASYKPAAALALGAAAALSYLSRSWVPLAASAATGYALMQVYERNMPQHLRREPVATLLGGPSLTHDPTGLQLTRPYQTVPALFDPVPDRPGPAPVSVRGTSIQFAGGGPSQEVF